LLTSCIAIPAATGREYSPSSEEIIEANAKQLRGKKPEQIARFLGHPYPLAATGAAVAMAEHGQKVLPLIDKLLADKHPDMRSGAVNVLTTLIVRLNRPDGKRPDKSEPLKITDTMTRTLERAAGLIEDPSPLVQQAMGRLARIIGDHKIAHRIVIKMAASEDAGVRAAALAVTRNQIKTPEVKAKVGMLVSSAARGNTARHWGLSHLLLQDAIEHAKVAIPVLAKFLDTRAHSMRGMFSDGAMTRALAVIEEYADTDDALAAVSGVCKCYVRIPDNDHRGWVQAKARCQRILEKMGPAAGLEVRKALISLRTFVKTVEDKEVKRLQTTRKGMDERIKHLEKLAARTAIRT